MKSRFLLAASAAAAAIVAATPASAATLLFELSGSRSATFTLQSNPVVPDRVNSQPILGGSQIFFNNVAGTFNGMERTANVNFGSGNILAALNITGAGLPFTQFGGTDVFSFVDGSPVFQTGTFQFTGLATGRSTLVISEVAQAIPEPATWAMMLIGFAFVGATARAARRRTKLTVSYA